MHPRARAGTGTSLLVGLLFIAPTLSAEDLLVCGWTSNNVLRYDENGDYLSDFVSNGDDGLRLAHSLRIGPDGKLYAGSFFNNMVLRYDLATEALIDTFVAPGSGGITGLTDAIFGPDGNLYASGLSSGTVHQYNGITGAFMSIFVTAGEGGLGSAEMLEWKQDLLYVCSASNSSIKRYDLLGNFVDTFVSSGSGGLSDPHSLVIKPTDGNLIVASFGDASVYEYDGTTGASLGPFISAGSGITQPHGVAYGPDGHLYVTSFGQGRVYRYDGVSGAFIDVFVDQGNGLNGASFLLWVPTIVDVADFPSIALDLLRVFPNPATALQTVEFGLASGAGTVPVGIFDAAGRRVRDVNALPARAGVYRFDWDGRDGVGRAVAPSVYFARPTVDGSVETIRLVRAR